jgi:hypothetical protein
MTFRETNQNFLLPGSQVAMVFGIIALCQPWFSLLHSYGVTIILAGLIGFNIFSKIKPPVAKE